MVKLQTGGRSLFGGSNWLTVNILQPKKNQSRGSKRTSSQALEEPAPYEQEEERDVSISVLDH